MNYFIYFVAIILIVKATNIGRKNESNIKLFSKYFWVQTVLLLIAIIAINNIEL